MSPQYRHYQACLNVLRLKPSGEAKEFGELISFVAQVRGHRVGARSTTRRGAHIGHPGARRAWTNPDLAKSVLPPLSTQVSKCYPRTTAGFAPEVMALLEGQAAHLDPALRRGLVQALILLRNRNQVRWATAGSACGAQPGIGSQRGSSAAACCVGRHDSHVPSRPRVPHHASLTQLGCVPVLRGPLPLPPPVPVPSQLDPARLLPLLFTLFRINDKGLRDLLFRHIVAGEAASRAGLPAALP
jgi:hypothetical protein